MREGAKPIEHISPRLLSKLLGQTSPDTKTTMVSIDNERSDFGQGVAQWSQLSARDDPFALYSNQEAAGVTFELIELPWQQVPFL